MRAILEFDLFEPDERKEHLRCVHSLDMALTIWELQYNLRKRIEHRLESDPKLEADILEISLEEVNDILSQIPINIDNLID